MVITDIAVSGTYTTCAGVVIALNAAARMAAAGIATVGIEGIVHATAIVSRVRGRGGARVAAYDW